METVQLIFGVIVILNIIFLILNYIIFDPIRKRKAIQAREEVRENRNKCDKRIAKSLHRKYNVNFYSNFTLIIYDYIKMYVEKTTTENKIIYNNFSNEEILEYLDLYDEYRHAQYTEWKITYDHGFQITEEINATIEYALKDIKDYLYTQNIHFPQYKLQGKNYNSIDDTINKEEKLIKQQIEKEKKNWKYTKIKHYFYFLLSFIISFMISNNANYIGISITVIVISFVVYFWRRDTVEYKFKIESLNQKLENLVGIPNDTYTLLNKAYLINGN